MLQTLLLDEDEHHLTLINDILELLLQKLGHQMDCLNVLHLTEFLFGNGQVQYLAG